MKPKQIQVQLVFILVLLLCIGSSCTDKNDTRILDSSTVDQRLILLKPDLHDKKFQSVKILNPSGIYEYSEFDTIQLISKIEYFDDEEIDENAIIWSSDKDGVIGTGPVLVTSKLSGNIHDITVKVNFTNTVSVIDDTKIAVTALTFEKTYGGRDIDGGYSVCEASDGNYVIAGYKLHYGIYSDMYLFKTDKSGNILWENTFGGEHIDGARSLKRTSDGGFIVVGFTRSYGDEKSDVYVVKTDDAGNFVWEKTYGGEDNDGGHSICKTQDGYYVIVGYTYSMGAGSTDVYLVKIDSYGNLIWEKTFGGAEGDVGNSIVETSVGDLVITGTTSSSGVGESDVLLIKTDSNGNLLWKKTFGGVERDFGEAVIEASDGSLIITGIKESVSNIWIGPSYLYLIKTDNSGNEIWEKTYGGSGNDVGRSLVEKPNGDIIVVGNTSSVGAGGADVYMIQTDINGNIVLERTYGGNADDRDLLFIKTIEERYLIIGNTYSYGAGRSDVYFLKLDSLGYIY